MSTRNSRSGGKFGGKHTNFIDSALALVDEAARDPLVTTISSGIITSVRSPGSSSGRRVKFSIVDGLMKMKVKQKGAAQQIRIYGKDLAATQARLIQVAKKENIECSVGQPTNSPLYPQRNKR